MAGIKNTLARALALYLALLPIIHMQAEAQAAGPAREPLPPVAPPRPIDPPGPPDREETPFTPVARPVTLRAFNGFTADAAPGLYRHRGHQHTGGAATVDSPWGERLEIRYWRNPHGLTLEYDRDLKVRYLYDDSGELAEIVAETPERQARMAVGNRAQLAYLGQLPFDEFDLSAYLLIDEALRAKHSDAFLDGLARFDGAAEASCVTQGIQCGVCILAWAASVAAISGACTAGTVVTFGASCLAAILVHEATSIGCAATCIEWAEDCLGGTPDGGNPIPDGCEP